jgi:hypothetical protein
VATIDQAEIGITKEGLESLAEIAAATLAIGVSSPINFKIGYFQVGDAGDIEDKKVYQGDCTDVFYVDYAAATYQAAHTTSITAVNAVAVDDSNTMAVDIECYLPPSAGATSYTCNEIMVFTGEGTIANPYKSFLYGVFPQITKRVEYGLNFQITCIFGAAEEA